MSELQANDEFFKIASWNILYDEREETTVPPQAERVASIAQTIRNTLADAAVVGLCEVHGIKNGKEIAQQSGLTDNDWAQHDRNDEYIGLIGKHLAPVTMLELGGNSTAAVTTHKDIAIAMVHLTYKPFGGSRLRSRQMQTLLAHLQDYSQAAIMGDFNTMPWQAPRRNLDKAGFHSIFKQLGIKYFATVPIPDYKPYLVPHERVASMFGGYAVDDIYIKGLEAQTVGILKGESDHFGLFADLHATQ